MLKGTTYDKKDNVGIVTHVAFWRRAVGNQQRIYELYCELSKFFNVVIFYTEKLRFEDAEIICGDDTFFNIECLINAKTIFKIENRPQYIYTKDTKSQPIRNFLSDITLKHNFKSIICEYITTADLIRDIDKNIIKILDTHDLMAKRKNTYNRNGRDHHINISEPAELRIFSSFDVVMAIQSNDELYLREKLKNTEVLLNPHPSVNINLFKDRVPKRIVYVAGSNPANCDSIRWFLNKVWIHFKNKDIELHIWGSITNSIKNYSNENTILHGYIDDVYKVYAFGDIVINPVLYGGGLKIKTVESMGYGMPLITTQEGANGLLELTDKAFLVADDPIDFRLSLERLIEKSSLRKELSDYSFNYAKNNFTPEKCFSNLIELIKKNKSVNIHNELVVNKEKKVFKKSNATLLVVGHSDFKLFQGIKQYFDTFAHVSFIQTSSLSSFNELKKKKKLYCADYIFFLNPYINKSNLQQFLWCKNNNIKYICFDRGALPDSWFFDKNGFNFNSESYDPINWDYKLNASKLRETKKYIDELKSSNSALEEQGPRFSASEIREKLGIDSSKKIIFVPFQRPTDTVIRYFAKEIGGFDGFLKLLTEINKKISRFNEDWIIVGKKHPLEVDNPEINIKFAPDDMHINDLIAISNVVLTINSGVGILAMLFNKKVICTGESFYAHEGLASTITDCFEFFNEIEYDHCRLDYDKVLRFIYFLRNEFYSFGKSNSRLEINEEGSYNRITESIDFYTINHPD